MINVGVGGEIEVDEDAHRAVVRVDGVHVVHVVHTAHLLLDGGGHGLLDGLSIGAYVVGLDEDLRRNDLGELRHRQAHQRDEANNDHDGGDHHRDDRAIDEEF